jgi:hypothetical protein
VTSAAKSTRPQPAAINTDAYASGRVTTLVYHGDVRALIANRNNSCARTDSFIAP